MDNKTIIEQAQAKIEEEKNEVRVNAAQTLLTKKARYQKEIDSFNERIAKIDEALAKIGTDRENEVSDFDF